MTIHASLAEALPALRAALAGGRRAVLEAPPGSGKTTRLPPQLLGEPWLEGRKVILLEPRRVAARAAARRMAHLQGEPVGGTIGYRTRMDTAVGPATRLEVVTEGVLTRMLQHDPGLDGVGLLLFDEFHERSLHADTGLALALETADVLRPDLRLVVMSATLDHLGVAALLGDAPVVRAAGRAYPVDTVWLGAPRRDVPSAVAHAVVQALAVHEGDVLAFLPGMREISAAARALDGAVPPRTMVLALHGTLPPAEQDRVLQPAPPGARKVVLATAIAQTSLTIEGIRVVVDAGLARVPRWNPARGMGRLETVRVSRASADQRRGRAGRTAPGTCYRLWSEAEHAALLAHDVPEILAADLAPLALDLAVMGIRDAGTLRWLDAPPAGAWAAARELLAELGALDESGAATRHGRAMGQLPLHPRLAHLLAAAPADARGVAADIAALLSERDLLRHDGGPPPADLQLRLDLLRRRGAAHPGADRGAVARARDAADRLRRQVRAPVTPSDTEVGELLALAYPDRVARRRPGDEPRFVLRNGTGARLAAGDALSAEPWLVVAETDGARPEARIVTAAPIAEAAVHARFGADIEQRVTVAIDDASGALRSRVEERLGAIVLAERAGGRPDVAATAAALTAWLSRRGVDALPWDARALGLRARLAFLHGLDAAWPDVADAALLASVDTWLAPAVSEAGSLRGISLGDLLLGRLDWRQRGELDALAPTHLEVPSGSRIALSYDDAASPVLAVRLQEMFGATTTPAVGGGRVPVTLHLLSPAGRPVQVTRDLPSFWRGAYFEVRKDLRGRYPKHHWPDDPMAAPPRRGARRRGE